LSGRGLCDELITRPEESYRLCCVVVCDLETSRMGAPYIYAISRLRVKAQICYTIYDYDSYLNIGEEPTPETSSIFMYLFIYDLFKNTVRHSAYIESNDRKDNE